MGARGRSPERARSGTPSKGATLSPMTQRQGGGSEANSLCLCLCLSISNICLSRWFCVSLCQSLCPCPSVRLSVRLSVGLSVCLSVYWSVLSTLISPFQYVLVAGAMAEEAEAGVFEVGQHVEVEKFPKTWYVGVVREVDGEKLFVHYEGWSEKWDEWVKTSKVHLLAQDAEGETRLKQQQRTRSPSPGPRRGGKGDRLGRPTDPAASPVRNLSQMINLGEIKGRAPDVFTESIDKGCTAVVVMNQVRTWSHRGHRCAMSCTPHCFAGPLFSPAAPARMCVLMILQVGDPTIGHASTTAADQVRAAPACMDTQIADAPLWR